MPGIGLVIDGAVQQAPHCGRHWKGAGVDSMAFEKWQMWTNNKVGHKTIKLDTN